MTEKRKDRKEKEEVGRKFKKESLRDAINWSVKKIFSYKSLKNSGLR